MEADERTLEAFVELSNSLAHGVKVRYEHPGASGGALGSFLGRGRDYRLSGDRRKVLFDIFLDPTSRKTPKGDLGGYVMDLAESDHNAFATSFVSDGKLEYRLAEDGTRVKGEDGKDLLPIWRPSSVKASDVVDTGAAASSFFGDVSVLSQEATTALERILATEDAEERIFGFLNRFFANRIQPAAGGAGQNGGEMPQVAQTEEAPRPEELEAAADEERVELGPLARGLARLGIKWPSATKSPGVDMEKYRATLARGAAAAMREQASEAVSMMGLTPGALWGDVPLDRRVGTPPLVDAMAAVTLGELLNAPEDIPAEMADLRDLVELGHTSAQEIFPHVVSPATTIRKAFGALKPFQPQAVPAMATRETVGDEVPAAAGGAFTAWSALHPRLRSMYEAQGLNEESYTRLHREHTEEAS